MIIDILGYRDWAKRIHELVSYEYRDVHWHDSLSLACSYAPMTFVVGWSNLIPEDKHKDRDFFVLHPSSLPKYRGGSPLQHQIIAGHKVSAITIFKLDEKYPEVDSGPIVWQMPFSLEGKLSDIFDRIVKVGSMGITSVIRAYGNGTLCPMPQDYDMGFTMPRRKPEESQIWITDIQEKTAEQLHNKIRALQDPYPNAYIVCGDGKKLYLTESHLDD